MTYIMFMSQFVEAHVHFRRNLLGESQRNHWWGRSHTGLQLLATKTNLVKKLDKFDVLNFLRLLLGYYISGLQRVESQLLDFFCALPSKAKFGDTRILRKVFGKGLN